MKIAFDARMILEHPTGIGRVAFNLLKALQEIDSENRYMVLHRSETFAPIPQVPNFELVECNVGQFSPSLHLKIPRLVKGFGVDLYFSPYFVVPFKLPCPSVIIVHDVIFSAFPDLLSGRKRLFYQLLSRLALASAARVTTDSENTRTDLLRYFPSTVKEKVQTLYIAADDRFMPVDDLSVLERFRQKCGLPQGYFCYVGNYKRHKNLEVLIEAFAMVKDEVSQCLVMLDNPGEDCQKIKELVRIKGLEGRVRFLQGFDDTDLPLLYNCADAFVFPSYYEGFGLPPLEAMACGTPVITSNASSIPEVVGDAGLMLDPQDTAGFAQSLQKVLGDEALRTEMRQKGLERARLFSWEKAGREMLALFEQVG